MQLPPLLLLLLLAAAADGAKRMRARRGKREASAQLGGGGLYAAAEKLRREQAALWGPQAELDCGPAVEHLSEQPAHGLHVLQPAMNEDLCAHGAASVRLHVFVDGVAAQEPPTLELQCTPPPADPWSVRPQDDWLFKPLRRIIHAERPKLHRRLRDAGTLTAEAEAELSRAAKAVDPSTRSRWWDDEQRWQLYTPGGSQLSREPEPGKLPRLLSGLQQCGTAYMFEGGLFLWPGIRPGYRLTLPSPMPGLSDITITTLSLQPRAFRIEPLLTPAECAQIIDAALPQLGEPSPNRSEEAEDHLRTSTQTVLQTVGAVEAAAVEGRVHGLMRVPEPHGEPLQFLRYLPEQRYDAHWDYCKCSHWLCVFFVFS